ncbi:MAG: outer membrane protein assembly factor BamD [Acidobacteria bacterium]|nr:outer membrane protein assembly factor BamD [Acidobacteriota bacterium]
MTRYFVILAVAAGLLTAPACRRKKYENPITKDTQQPDKVLFDKAIADIERGRYEIARLTLNTLMNTYVDSEFMAKAKLAIADTWFREGGSHGLAQAEAEYKDFILFYPTLEEASEAQRKVCMIHYRQMEKPDRDALHAVRAEEECRQLLVQFPNSQYRVEVEQLLRNIQEVLAAHEFGVGEMYHKKGSFAAAANRLDTLTDHYPLFSRADEALWKLGDSYSRMGPRFRDRAGEAYTRIVREYPLSALVDAAKGRLKAMEMPIPDPDEVALARMQYELENSKKPGLMHHFWGVFRKSPDTTMAAKSGAPAMESLRPSAPATVPGVLPAGEVSAEVTASPITGPSALDTQPDARQRPPSEAKPEPQEPPAPPARKNEQKKKK